MPAAALARKISSKGRQERRWVGKIAWISLDGGASHKAWPGGSPEGGVRRKDQLEECAQVVLVAKIGLEGCQRTILVMSIRRERRQKGRLDIDGKIDLKGRQEANQA